METPHTSRFAALIASDRPVLVDFYATWCGPCKAMQPVLEQLKAKLGEQLTIIKVDVDKNPAAAAAYQVQGVPTLILFRNGSIRWKQAGAVPAHTLEQIIRQYL